MARAKKIVTSPHLDVAIYQDEGILYSVHLSCGPRAQFLDDDIWGWACNTCGLSHLGSTTPAKSELRVGPRRTAKAVQEWAAPWLDVPEARVEVGIKR